MSKKYEKTIFVSPKPGPIKGIPQLKAVVAARRTRGALPTYIRTYHVTAGRVRHFERMLLDGVRRKIKEAEQVTGAERERLSMIVADLLNTAVMVARIGEIGYGIPMSEDARGAIELLNAFRLLALVSSTEQNDDPESFCIPGYPGKETQSFGQSLWTGQSPFG